MWFLIVAFDREELGETPETTRVSLRATIPGKTSLCHLPKGTLTQLYLLLPCQPSEMPSPHPQLSPLYEPKTSKVHQICVLRGWVLCTSNNSKQHCWSRKCIVYDSQLNGCLISCYYWMMRYTVDVAIFSLTRLLSDFDYASLQLFLYYRVIFPRDFGILAQTLQKVL